MLIQLMRGGDQDLLRRSVARRRAVYRVFEHVVSVRSLLVTELAPVVDGERPDDVEARLDRLDSDMRRHICQRVADRVLQQYSTTLVLSDIDHRAMQSVFVFEPELFILTMPDVVRTRALNAKPRGPSSAQAGSYVRTMRYAAAVIARQSAVGAAVIASAAVCPSIVLHRWLYDRDKYNWAFTRFTY